MAGIPQLWLQLAIVSNNDKTIHLPGGSWLTIITWVLLTPKKVGTKLFWLGYLLKQLKGVLQLYYYFFFK